VAIFSAAVAEPLQITPPFPTKRQPVEPRDGFAPGDTAHATSAAISASQNASAAPIATLLAARGSAFLYAPFAL